MGGNGWVLGSSMLLFSSHIELVPLGYVGKGWRKLVNKTALALLQGRHSVLEISVCDETVPASADRDDVNRIARVGFNGLANIVDVPFGQFLRFARF